MSSSLKSPQIMNNGYHYCNGYYDCWRKKDNIEAKLDNIRKQFNGKMDSLKENLNQETLARCKADLVSLMSKIKNGYTPTVEEKLILHESKKKYNDLGGDSYVDEMFDNLVKEGKI